jgi:hypothetical protein
MHFKGVNRLIHEPAITAGRRDCEWREGGCATKERKERMKEMEDE